MEKLQLILLIFQVVIALILILSILIQKSSSDSLGGIGGGSGGLNSGISARATASALTKFTMILIVLFMINSLILARISFVSHDSNKLQIDKAIETESKQNNSPSLPDVE